MRAVALTSTIYTVLVDLSDVDRGVYETLDLKVAMHPSESPEYMVTRILAYCLEYTDGIAFSAGGLSSPDEPPVLVRDLTGKLTAWIDIGIPDPDRLHRAAKLCDRVAVYTHREPRQFLSQFEGKKIFRRDVIELFAFDRKFIADASALLERRTKMTISVTEGHVYMEMNGRSFETVVARVELPA